MTKQSFDHILKHYMKQTYTTLGQLAQQTNIPKGSIINWRKGRVKRPRRWQDVINIARAMHLNPSETDHLLQAAHHAPLSELHRIAQSKEERELLTRWQNMAQFPPKLHDPTQLPVDVFPPLGEIPPCSRLPLRCNPHFVGREATLQQMAETLKTSSTIAVTGLGGLGKTQLAVEFAHRYGRYFSGGVFWISFAQPTTIPDQIAACGGARHLDLRPNFFQIKLNEQLQLVQKAWAETTPRLLIFDQCEDEQDLIKWRPTHGGCRIILTSRRINWSSGLDITPLTLDTLNRAECINLLCQLHPHLKQKEADMIAQELGNLPLALHLAGNFLRCYDHDISPAQYIADLQNRHGGLLLQHQSLQGWGTQTLPTGHVANVARTIEVSYQQLKSNHQRDALALALLARAVCFAPNDPIPYALLQATITNSQVLDATAPQMTQALTRLLNLGLITEAAGKTIRLHQIIREFVQEKDHDAQAQTDAEKTILIEAQQLKEYPDPTLIQSRQNHLHYITEIAIKREDALAGKLCTILGHSLWFKGEYQESHHYHQLALTIKKNLFGTHHLETAESLDELAYLFYHLGEFKNAQYYFEQSLAVKESILDSNHPEIAYSLDGLAGFFDRKGSYEQARTYYKRALKILEGNDRVNQSKAITCLNNYSLLLKKLGQYKESKHYCEQVIALSEKEFGINHPKTAIARSNLGTLMCIMGAYEEAQGHYKHTLSIMEIIMGPEHPYTAKSLNNLGYLFLNKKDYQAAKPLFDRALQIQKDNLKATHADRAKTLTHLALWHEQTGDLAAAQSCFEQALHIREVSFGSEHPQIADSLTHLGHCLQALGDYESAFAYYKQALTIQDVLLDPNHPDTAVTHHNLGTLYQQTGDPDLARHHLEYALKSRQQKLGEQHEETIKTRSALNQLHQARHAKLQK